mmetsp:Transcript_23943/g.58108  ORF Transcript_23943/g.58108 Transcript_23943/m.58108 type:complete len:229 (-) Transcript_23943:147-833(-)
MSSKPKFTLQSPSSIKSVASANGSVETDRVSSLPRQSSSSSNTVSKPRPAIIFFLSRRSDHSPILRNCPLRSPRAHGYFLQKFSRSRSGKDRPQSLVDSKSCSATGSSSLGAISCLREDFLTTLRQSITVGFSGIAAAPRSSCLPCAKKQQIPYQHVPSLSLLHRPFLYMSLPHRSSSPWAKLHVFPFGQRLPDKWKRHMAVLHLGRPQSSAGPWAHVQCTRLAHLPA